MDQRYKEKHVRDKRWKARRKKTRIWSRREGDCVVYCLTNRINGKMYVGYTSKSVFERWGEGGKKYKGCCPAIWAAIEKYSWSNFEKRILVDGLNEDMAKEIEVFTITFLKERGNTLYNLTDGGDSSPMKNPEVAAKFKGENNPIKKPEVAAKHKESMNRPEVRGAISRALMGHDVSKETRGKISKNNAMKRPEVRAKNADAQTKKPVIAINAKTGLPSLYFESTMSAERLGFNNSNIVKCCKQRRKTHGGYVWKYKKDS